MESVYNELEHLISQNKKFNTFIEIYQYLNTKLDIEFSLDAWRKRKRRNSKFNTLLNSLINTTNKPVFTGNKFETLDTDKLVEKVKNLYNSTKQQFSENIIKLDTDSDICIVALGDTHIGKGLNISKLLEDIEIIANTPNMYVLLMGDYSDNFFDGKWCMNIALIESLTPREQIKLTEYIFNRLKGKILGLVFGNHTGWLTIGDWNPLLTILESMNYTGFVGTNRLDLTLILNGIEHKIRMMHDWSGKSATNVTYGIEKSRKTDTFNIGIAAHTHEGALYREFVHEGKKCLAIKCGSYKVDDYAFNLGFNPSGNVNGESAVPIIITTTGNYSNAPTLKHAAKLLKG